MIFENWIVKHGGMALLNTHPDYMSFDGNNPKRTEYPVELYEEFLEYIKEKYPKSKKTALWKS